MVRACFSLELHLCPGQSGTEDVVASLVWLSSAFFFTNQEKKVEKALWCPGEEEEKLCRSPTKQENVHIKADLILQIQALNKQERMLV